jgi:hypothetical protein
MSPSLQQDLRQTKPFSSLQQEAYLSVVRTTSTLTDRVEDLLKPFGISATSTTCCGSCAARAGGTVPERAARSDAEPHAGHDPAARPDGRGGLVTRSRERDDRRMVLTQITARGRELLGELDRPMAQLHREQLSQLTDEQLRSLIDLLTLVREGSGG